MEAFIVNPITKERYQVFAKEKVSYAVLEISPSKLTSNSNVRWLLSEFARYYQPLEKRINFTGGMVTYSPEITIWWEVFMYKGQIKFYLVIPDKDDLKNAITRQVMKTWKQSNVREVADYMPDFDTINTSISKLNLQHHSILSIDTQNPTYSPLDSLLNAKHYLTGEDIAMLQIGMKPMGEGWNDNAVRLLERIRGGEAVPRKKGKRLTFKEAMKQLAYAVGIISEELMNLLGDFLIPGWENNTELVESLKNRNGEVDNTSTKNKSRSEAFKSEIRVVARSDDKDRRASIIRAMVAGFDPLEADNRFIEVPVTTDKQLYKEVKRVTERRMTIRMNGDILCSLELAKLMNVPDQKAQAEHYNELNLVTHRGESEVPRDIFINDEGSVPFATYEDTDGNRKLVYFNGKNKNLLCMPRVIIGEPGTGKTSFAVNNALDSFNQGYGVMCIDAADGKLVQRILNHITPEQRKKVKIIDFLNTEYPIGLGWNEIFRGRNIDIIEDLVVEEVLTYVELVSGTPLNMRAKQWVENAVKATFITPDATLQDVESMLNNAVFRNKIIPTIKDPELRADWEYYHNMLKPEERKNIYDEAFRRLAPVMRKKTLKNFILQRPKKDEEGNYLFDLRKWMDEGYMVLVKATETLGETLQTALVSFLISKFNLAMISREDIPDEDNRPPCFLFLDEPDHYIKGSDRWRNMLTRFRKYRAGLNLMFHGWQQLKEADRDLPKIIRKAGPHYIIFQTDEDNLQELKTVIEPEFKVHEVAKGMPQFHAIARLKMYGTKGETMPAFMVKAIDIAENRYATFSNDDMYVSCASELGRPKDEVMEELFRDKMNAEFDMSVLTAETSTDGDGELRDKAAKDDDEEDREEHNKHVKKVIQHEVAKFIQNQIDRGEEPDEDLLIEMDSLLEEG